MEGAHNSTKFKIFTIYLTPSSAMNEITNDVKIVIFNPLWSVGTLRTTEKSTVCSAKNATQIYRVGTKVH
jgi:hypothetical protein